ncbi:MAG: hypothetical protein A2359_02305 [Candidatus Moranbacteria bacterium RIFOXYB1_FULL_43_19]|nr:MAG: hypothetical protein A2184_04555 [Candidatus Moranbacteria bacterium RIFOXYA1_FULL_44_7]OGI28010.1 MAG: hypothetical protein A2359_02305 [Candidatus Moranbacteria bacterium RIFOXYB1_FULL_43_19]OGI33556.1 MAG: hypothetical protein A2420_00350 [Candidatus Moranbacteria bacterium RIFOXYC1_FULL_44_13]OGI37531.1 MAG: hypothetical protein A2612_05355 [Candidatus Moranbacteria bacterium RIFOXYD1_FULL_44_12]
MKTKTKRQQSKKACPPVGKGSALLLTTILLFVVLSMVVSLSYVTVMEQQMSSKTKSSVSSFFKADSGVEWALNKIANATGTTIISVFDDFTAGGKIPCPTGFGCDLYLLDENGKVIIADADISTVKAVRAVGTQTTGDPTQRAIEAAVAAGGSFSYTATCLYDAKMATPVCPASVVIGTQGLCDSGFNVAKDLGEWGVCYGSTSDWCGYSGCNINGIGGTGTFFYSPGSSCGSVFPYKAALGKAYLCSK